MKSNLIRAGLSLLIAFSTLTSFADSASQQMTDAANAFLAALKEDQKAKATFQLKDDERLNWHFIPRDRKGLPMKEMETYQRVLAMALLNSGLSQKGFYKSAAIMSLEQILAEMEGSGARFRRDPDLYFVSIFGTPDAKKAWGWRVEGHHLAINFTVVNGKVAGSPSFMGTNPAEVRQGARKGLRVLAAEEDLGRDLVKSLSADQQKKAIISEKAPADIITGADRKAKPLKEEGITYSALNNQQKQKLETLLREYVYRCRAEVADLDFQKIKQAGMDKIWFAWAGGTEKNEPHYYRVQGPTFLLEYDNTQNNNNHVHAVWRDFEGDFGEDILRKHYEQNPH